MSDDVFLGDELPVGLTDDIVDVGCPYFVGTLPDTSPCPMPVEVVQVRTFHSSDPSGHTIVVQYRCLGGHRWMDDGPAEPVEEDYA